MISAAEITALSTGIPAILAAVGALVKAFKANSTATIAQGTAVHANNTINAHLTREHDMFPIQPPIDTSEAHLQAGDTHNG